MKRAVFCAAVVLVISFSLAALGKRETTAGTAGIITVGYAQGGAASPWRNANTGSFRNTFTEENGFRLLLEDAGEDQDAQIEAIRGFIRQGADYIAVAPVTETGWEPVLTEARDAGIPVILSGRMLKLRDQNLYTAWIGGNFLKEGQDAIAWLDSYIVKSGLSERELAIVLIQGETGSSAQVGRTQGVTEGIVKNPKYKLLAKQSGGLTREGGYGVMSSFLSTLPAIDVVIAENDSMAFGAVSAIRDAGKEPGKDTIVISFGANREALERITGGDITCSVEYNPLYGPLVADTIRLLESGKPAGKIVYAADTVFDSGNAGKALPDREY